jgi:hypothetical protein
MLQTLFNSASHWFAHVLASTEVLWIAEWTGALLAIGGALVMSMNRGWSRHAWAIWIASNVLLIAPIAYAQCWGLLMTQFAFLLVNINGLLRHRRRARPSTRRTTKSPRRAEGLRREPIHRAAWARAIRTPVLPDGTESSRSAARISVDRCTSPTKRPQGASS